MYSFMKISGCRQATLRKRSTSASGQTDPVASALWAADVLPSRQGCKHKKRRRTCVALMATK